MLDADIFGAGDAQKTGGAIAIETDVAVSEIVNHHEAELPRERYQVHEEFSIDDGGGRVVRIIHHHNLRSRIQVLRT